VASSSASSQTTAEPRGATAVPRGATAVPRGATAVPRGAAARGRWRAAAFGLTIAGSDAIIGLAGSAAAPEPGAPEVRLELTDRAALDQSWPATGAQRIAAQLRTDVHAPMVIDEHMVAGYRMTGTGYGRALIAPHADRVRLAPTRGSRLRWQRYLLGQVLPFVAGLNGVELLHAGAVRLGDAVVGIVGGSGRGKSSLVAALVNRGAKFVADDVLALTRRSGSILGHPGPGVLVLSSGGLALQVRSPGPSLLRGHGEVALGLEPAPAAPLQALCFLERDDGPRLVIEDLPTADPRRLLGSGYEVVRRGPERLRTQFELTSELAARARLLRLSRAPDAHPDAVAVALLSELGFDR
jgi:hypothetical protein